jgi:hypothetical protein
MDDGLEKNGPPSNTARQLYQRRWLHLNQRYRVFLYSTDTSY